jgi:2-polyprenyl-3-methyl-5-hydroxy-6-metoxy-1,4-benzoquinol methylase
MIVRIQRKLQLASENGSDHDRVSRLLDVGCGYGFFSREALRQGFDVTALEVSDHEAGVAESVVGLQPIRSSFEEFDSRAPFDAILMSQVLEHALEPSVWISKARELLRPGGVLAIAVPNFGGIFRRLLGVRDFMIIPPAHLNYFDPKSIATLLSRSGFTAIEVRHVTRVPRDTIRRRIGAARGVVSGVELVSQALCAGIDTARLGGIINVYATRN